MDLVRLVLVVCFEAVLVEQAPSALFGVGWRSMVVGIVGSSAKLAEVVGKSVEFRRTWNSLSHLEQAVWYWPT